MRRPLFLGLLLSLLVSPAFAVDPVPKQAKSKWQADGMLYTLAPGRALYVGTMTGTFFVKNTAAHAAYMNAAHMVCPFSIRVQTDRHDTLQGACQFTDQSGDLIRAELACVGKDDVCNGRLQIVSGTGRFAGIQGGGKVQIREDGMNLEHSSDVFGVPAAAGGYLVIKDLQDNVVITDEGPRVP